MRTVFFLRSCSMVLCVALLALGGCKSSDDKKSDAGDGGGANAGTSGGHAGKGGGGTGGSGAGGKGSAGKNGGGAGSSADAGNDEDASGGGGAGSGSGAHDAGLDAATAAAGSDAGSDAGCTMLTVYDEQNWCNVTVAGGTPFTVGSTTVCVPPGAVTLTATPENGSFELGSWHHTDNAGTVTGSTVSGVNTTTITVSGATACAWVCCPFSSNGSGCAQPGDIANDPCL